MSLADRIDQALSVVAPRWAANRAAARAELAAAQRLAGSQFAGGRGYRDTRRNRLTRSRAFGGRADYHLESTWDRRDLVDLARRIERETVMGEGLLSRSVENVVGTGYRLQAQTQDDSWNALAEETWRQWSRTCDVRRMSTFGELLQLTFRSYLRDGDVGTVLLRNGQIQSAESDQIASPRGNFLARSHVDGIDLDPVTGEPIQYHFVAFPDPRNTAVRFQQSTIIPAADMVFLARRQRLGQTRGLTAFSAVVWLLEQLDGNVEAVTVAARMSALFSLVLKKRRKTGNLATTEAGDGTERRKISWEPGSILELYQDEDAVPLTPQQPGGNFSEFMRSLVRLSGIPFGLPLEVSLNDWSQSNFSSARGALLQAWQTWKCHQETMKGWSSRIYEWKILNWIRQGVLPANDEALRHQWLTPGWQWIDPSKEIAAALAEVDAGLSTIAELNVRRGKDPEEVLIARAREIERMAEAGLPEIRSTMTRDPQQPPPEPTADGEDD